MKHKRRLICLLLIVVMLVGMFPAIFSNKVDAAAQLTAIGSSPVLSGMPSVVEAESITYLSDLYSTDKKVDSFVIGSGASVSNPRDFKLDINWDNALLVFIPNQELTSSSRYKVPGGSPSADTRTWYNYAYGQEISYNRADVALGARGTKFSKALSFIASPTGTNYPDTSVVFDVSALDADYFYSVAGITGEASNPKTQDMFLQFEVWGSKDTTYNENTQFEKLAYVSEIRQWLVGEFNIKITGYNYIKLVAVNTSTRTSGTTNQGLSGAWGGACVYKLPTTNYSVGINWDDTYNPQLVRPENDMTVQLYADGVAVDGQSAVLNAGNGWSATFSGLSKYQDDLSTEIVYTAALAEDPALHRLVSNENGAMTYQYDATLTTKDIPLSLVWNDENTSNRANAVTVQLYADGVSQTGKTLVLNKDNDWAATFTNLPEKKRVSDSETADIIYTFKVLTRVNNYTSSITESDSGIVVTMTYSASTAQKFSTIGMSGTLEGIPSEATGANTHFLTDLLNGRNKKVTSQYIADGGKYRSFENYQGKVRVFYEGKSDAVVEAADTVVNGNTYQPTDIVLGPNGTVYSDGLSFNVSSPDANDTYIIYDLTGMNATNFYAVAGVTDAANDIKTTTFLLNFEVWGSKDGTTYEKLGYTEKVRSYLRAEFDVDITGYNYLKLTAYNTGDYSDTVAAVWADALVYCVSSTPAPEQPTEPTPTEPQPTEPTPTEPTEPEEIPGKYTASSDGTYAGIQAADDSVVYLSDASATDATKGKYITSWYVSPKGGIGQSRYPSLDYPFTKTANDPIVVGAKSTNFQHGLGVLPVAGTSGQKTYIMLDISSISDADRFYAVAGITGTGVDKDGNRYGVVFEVYGSDKITTNENDASFKKLAVSGDIFGKDSGEFDVDITGIKTLKLVTLVADSNKGRNNSNTQSIWANACVYKYEEGGSVPSEPSEPTEPSGSLTDSGDVDTSVAMNYTASEKGLYQGISQAKDGSIVKLSDEKYVGASYILPSATNPNRTVRINTVNLNEDVASSAIIGAKKTAFAEHLTMHPNTLTADTYSYTELDLTGLDVDRFYSAVGIHSPKNDTIGVVFNVFGFDSAKNDYVLLGTSSDVHGSQSGEFNIDITGYSKLKLEVALASDSVDHYSRISSWCNICVYKYDENAEEPTTPTEPKDYLDSGDVDTSKALNFTESKDGTYAGITKAAKDSYASLSDEKYVGDSYILPSATNPNRTVRIDTVDLNNDGNSSAIIGAKKTKFDQHLTMHPNAKNADTYSYAELDLTGLDVDRFYSVVGIHNPKNDVIGVVFNVFGYSALKDDYVLLGTSSDLHGKQSGEFDINISGYKKLKIEVALASDSADHYSRISSWCDIAVYKYDPNGSVPEAPAKDPLPGVYTSSANGAYKWITNAKNSAVTYLSKLVYTDSSNSSANKPTTKNEPYGEAGKKIIIGEKNTGFTYGLGVHPKSGSAQAYTIYDLTALDVNRFYSAVGITNAKGKEGSSKGVIFQVYADYEGDGSYKLLAESDTITKKASGEFHVDITGAKSLKLVTLSATGDHASSASAWAAACVYKYDAKGGKPTSYTTVGASNAAATKSDNTGLKPTAGFTPSVEGEYIGVDKKHTRSIVYLSDIEYLEASNTTNSANPNGQPTTLDHPYNELTNIIILGEDEHAFHKGLGVHPKNPNSPVDGSIQSWTTYDVSKLDADRFYAAVGITNDKGKEGASKGVIFRVYADYGDGNFKQLAHSGCLVGRESGEFDLDISGVKTLKLCVESASTANTSSASAWANACVYDSKSVTEGVGKPVIKQPSVVPPDPTEATEPTVDIPVEETTTSPVTIAAIAVIGVLAVLIIVLSALLAAKSKKARK